MERPARGHIPTYLPTYTGRLAGRQCAYRPICGWNGVRLTTAASMPAVGPSPVGDYPYPKDLCNVSEGSPSTYVHARAYLAQVYHGPPEIGRAGASVLLPAARHLKRCVGCVCACVWSFSSWQSSPDLALLLPPGSIACRGEGRPTTRQLRVASQQAPSRIGREYVRGVADSSLASPAARVRRGRERGGTVDYACP